MGMNTSLKTSLEDKRQTCKRSTQSSRAAGTFLIMPRLRKSLNHNSFFAVLSIASSNEKIKVHDARKSVILICEGQTFKNYY